MALYETGQTVYAAKYLGDSACGDHPALHHAARGDALIVIAHDPKKIYPYTVSHNADGSHPFGAEGTDLMSQKPFDHNDITLQGSSWAWPQRKRY